MARMEKITGKCSQCGAMASSEVLTLAQRFKLCAHCVLVWWASFMDSSR